MEKKTTIEWLFLSVLHSFMSISSDRRLVYVALLTIYFPNLFHGFLFMPGDINGYLTQYR